MTFTKPSWFLPFLFFLCCNISISFASDHISFNNSLSGNQTISSQGGKFELGFFQLGKRSASSNYYLGIWYKKVSEFTPVWIANRNTPISDPNTSELRILATGNLALLDYKNTQIWSTNISSLSSNSTICTLLDTGNLVLQYSSNQTATLLWQSVDYPTDTWLPGGKLGRSKATGTHRMVSRKNSDDPAEGIYSIEIDPNGSSQFFIYWNRSRPYWTSGKWNGKSFTNLPEMQENYQYNFEYVSNENENYFTYSVQDDSIISRLVMDLSGQVKQLTWLEEQQQWILVWIQPQAQCDVYALCGPFGSCDEKSLPYCSCLTGFKEVNSTEWELSDPTGGCVRKSPLKCSVNNDSSSNGPNDQFFQMSTIRLPDNPHVLNTANTIQDCEIACLQNCSCNAFAYNSMNCSVWYENLLNLHQETDGSGETLFLRLSASELKNGNHMKKDIIWIIIGSVIGFLVCTVIILLLVRVYQLRKFVLAIRESESSLVTLTYGDLKRMTNNFSERLGRGGFGSVFKGTLPNSRYVAVKRLEGNLQVGEKQFRNEVSTIGIVQHVNLARLRGLCCERNKRLLVYDYMENGSLDTKLFHGSSTVLDWNRRYQIALGAARGLAYLHESCRDCIIHCDVKPENILLDKHFVPKVADFGMAKLVGREFSRVLTTVRGTIGYLAPEWLSGVAISVKADVYSFGMVLLELVSGRRNSEELEGHVDYFPLLAAIKLHEGNVFSLLDHRLNGDANLEEVERVCKVACWCIQNEEHNRPTMGQVLQILEGSLEVGVPPIPRLLKVLTEDTTSLVFFGEHSHGEQSSWLF
ncbi:Serine/threonine-protein kinase [Rhynchospora pubera]|uniref:Receptor-like serine/threonine-protein kinase n=2 Tax=Rhynchospora pubera TaxID=906938 RepID=A0AAV8CQ10_9POAL|nr:Serine/threonine-protein kinase [Rhynchospora pubera]